MKKILFVAQNLHIGGVQKALVNHLKTMSVDDEIHLFTFGDGPFMDEIPSMVHVTTGNVSYGLLQHQCRWFCKAKRLSISLCACFSLC